MPTSPNADKAGQVTPENDKRTATAIARTAAALAAAVAGIEAACNDVLALVQRMAGGGL